jgi:hypothetical protein
LGGAKTFSFASLLFYEFCEYSETTLLDRLDILLAIRSGACGRWKALIFSGVVFDYF